MLLLSPSAISHPAHQVVNSVSDIGHNSLHRGRAAVTTGPSSLVTITDGTPAPLN